MNGQRSSRALAALAFSLLCWLAAAPAASAQAPTPSPELCGNARVDPGEECDNNGQSGGCCTAQCRFAPSGLACSDGNPRTVDACNRTGTCVGLYPQAGNCAPPSIFDPVRGVCATGAPTASSGGCGDGLIKGGVEECDSGSRCADGRDCSDDPSICGDGTCHVRQDKCCTAQCTFAAAGGACSDDNACTAGDACNGAGRCVGSTNVPAGATCSDSNGCTPNDACDGAGTCIGTGQINCDGSDACHPTGFCSPATGTCITCRDPFDAQDSSYCAPDTGQCVSQNETCPDFLIEADGSQNLCVSNSGRDPKTGQCLYQSKTCVADGCIKQACDPADGKCKLDTTDPSYVQCGGDNNFCRPEADCLVGTCFNQTCSPQGQAANCDSITNINCQAVNPGSCQYVPVLTVPSQGLVNGCREGEGCVFAGINCPPPSNPCEELVRESGVPGCCTYRPRNCAAEFGNNPNYTYSCDPTTANGVCEATLKPELCNGADDNGNGQVDEGFLNTDGDAQADCTDPDDDNDGALDTADNCPLTPNATQADTDGDRIGDACDALSYNFAGFFQPVDNFPVDNVANAGAAIPVRFSLGGDFGLNVFAPGYPAAQQMVCAGTPNEDAIETTAAGNSGLSYDPATSAYSYVWKTDKAWKGTCRQLVVKFRDGSAARVANFRFK